MSLNSTALRTLVPMASEQDMSPLQIILTIPTAIGGAIMVFGFLFGHWQALLAGLGILLVGLVLIWLAGGAV